MDALKKQTDDLRTALKGLKTAGKLKGYGYQVVQQGKMPKSRSLPYVAFYCHRMQCKEWRGLDETSGAEGNDKACVVDFFWKICIFTYLRGELEGESYKDKINEDFALWQDVMEKVATIEAFRVVEGNFYGDQEFNRYDIEGEWTSVVELTGGRTSGAVLGDVGSTIEVEE